MNGLTAVFLSFCCGFEVAWWIKSATTLWIPAMTGAAALLFVTSFLIGMRKLA